MRLSWDECFIQTGNYPIKDVIHIFSHLGIVFVFVVFSTIVVRAVVVHEIAPAASSVSL